MIQINRSGVVLSGPLKGWWIKVQDMEQPKGFLVSRARNQEMDQTLILDGIFPTRAALDVFFEDQAPSVDWQETGFTHP